MDAMAPSVDERIARVGGLDLEPITFKLMHPHPGQTAFTLVEADRMVLDYRRYLTLCVLHPDESLVPTGAIDEVWHTHILDTAKYAQDCQHVFGFLLHHFPYLGLRGEADEARWQAQFAHTGDLWRQAFGTEITAGENIPGCHNNGMSCQVGTALCCDVDDEYTADARPRPDRQPSGV